MRVPLVVGIGNALRVDDGAGAALAEALRRPGVRVVVVHQLGPELCDEVAAAAAVLFVDARRGGAPGTVALTPLVAGGGSPATTHAVAPEVVLAAAERLCGRRPPAALLTVSGADFGLGERLSPPVAAALPDARAAAERFLAPFLGTAATAAR